MAGKRIATIGILVVGLLLCGCAHAPQPVAATPQPTASPEVTVTAEMSASATTPGVPVRVRGYGEERMLVADGNGFTGVLRYPQGGVLPVNQAIAAWAKETYLALESRSATEAPDADGMRASMEIDYDAYLYKERYIGIREAGVYRVTVSGEATPVLYAFNYDLTSSKPLTLSDVIDVNRMAEVSALITERLMWLDATALEDAGALTAATMQNFVVRDDGIEWLFSGETGVVGVLIDYASLVPYLCMTNPDSAEPAAEAAPKAVKERESTAICLYDGVQVRAVPSVREGSVLGLLDAGETIDVLRAEALQGWYKIAYDGQVAYVDASLVRLSDADAPYETGYVTSAYLHVRDCASTEGALLGTMTHQEPVRVVDENSIDGWYKIWYEGGIAYAYARYIELARYPSETQTPLTGPETDMAYETPSMLRRSFAQIVGVGVCTTEGAIVHSAPNMKSPAFGTLIADEQVYVMEEECAAGWDRIFVYTEANLGYTGFLQACYVTSFVPDVIVAQ